MRLGPKDQLAIDILNVKLKKVVVRDKRDKKKTWIKRQKPIHAGNAAKRHTAINAICAARKRKNMIRITGVVATTACRNARGATKRKQSARVRSLHQQMFFEKPLRPRVGAVL